jgi:hypothetical protein
MEIRETLEGLFASVTELAPRDDADQSPTALADSAFRVEDSLRWACNGIMFVNWRDMEGFGGHPLGFNASNFTPARLAFVQKQGVNTHGFYSGSVIPGFENQCTTAFRGRRASSSPGSFRMSLRTWRSSEAS